MVLFVFFVLLFDFVDIFFFFPPQIFCSQFVEHPHSMTEVLSLLLKMTDNKHENSSPSEKQTARLQAYCDVLEVGYHTHTHTHTH